MEKKKKGPTPNPSRRDGSENVEEKGMRKEHRKNWRELYASIDDIKQFLLERVILRHNVITQQTEVHVIEQAPKPPDEATARPEDYVRWLKEWQEWIKPTPTPTPYPSPREGTDYPNSSDSNYLPSLGEGSGVGYYVLLTDRIENTLYTELKAQKEVRMQDLHSVIESDFVPEYHPFREYLEHLPPWREGDADHIMGLSLSVNVRGDADEQMLFYEYLKKWLVAMDGGVVGGPRGGEQRDAGADRRAGVVQDDVVLVPAAAGAAALLLHEDECEPHDEGRPLDAVAVRSGVL